ncbi:hypothetical protein E2C01_004958 [Portunus trituberculatus]|uniref:Uncharacterized protein n=1 Tax=Portunus trituberculatus TaxID=210409 RepID=A0A5B7CVB2_PORTR|nr:hypothetical protein [Portunus trituberculatus]
MAIPFRGPTAPQILCSWKAKYFVPTAPHHEHEAAKSVPGMKRETRSRRLNVQQGGGGLQVSRDVTSHCGRELSQFVYMRGAEGGRFGAKGRGVIGFGKAPSLPRCGGRGLARCDRPRPRSSPPVGDWHQTGRWHS